MSEMMLDEVFCNKERIKGVKAGLYATALLLAACVWGHASAAALKQSLMKQIKSKMV
jgi:hypothetical protein